MRARAAAAFLACVQCAFGYYHYVHYNSRLGPFVPVYEKFDLAALPNRTVSFFIQDPSGVQLAPADTSTGLISQIRAGARVWNDVATSELRIAFGGIVPAGTPLSGPRIEILFDDEMPPGVLAMGGPRVIADSNGSMIPIQVAQVVLRRDLTSRPTYGEGFSGTFIHEFGHALGLQHTLTSSAMSTEVTRATSKARPLTADDIAGISVLYPARTFGSSTGTISGRVLSAGQGVNLASVVALWPNGHVVSALTHPDGTYRIEGVPPGQYFVYAHPLPPAIRSEPAPAGITWPLGPDNRTFSERPVFDTQFFPGVRDPQQAFAVPVTAGAAVENINFEVRPRGPLQLHSVETYGFPAQVATRPAYLHPASVRSFAVAGGAGLMSGGQTAPGLSVNVIGGQTLNVRPYAPGGPQTAFAQLDVDLRSFAFSGEGPRHLLFTTPSELYVLPSGLYQVQGAPPQITGVAPGTDSTGARVALISGAGFGEGTRFLFDGVAGVRRGTDENGRIIVTPPPALAGHRANLVALNPDGQSSLFLSAEPVTWAYDDGASAAAVLATPSSVPAGVELLVTVDASGMTFTEGQVAVGFGSPEIQVRRSWVVSPTRLLLSVFVHPRAAAGSTTLTVVSGLQTAVQPFAFGVLPPNPRALVIGSQLTNTATGNGAVWAGSPASVPVLQSPVALASSGLTLFLNDRAIPATFVNEQIQFTIPAGTPAGPAVIRVQTAGETSLPVVVQIDTPPPVITGTLLNGQPIEGSRNVRPGDYLTLVVSGLAEPGAAVNTSRVLVSFGGVESNPQQVSPDRQSHLVVFVIPAAAPAGAMPVALAVDGKWSAPVTVTVLR